MAEKSPIVQAIKTICEEKNLPLQMVVETVEAALAAAYRKDYGQLNQNIKVDFDLADGSFKVFDIKEVVEDPPPPEENEEDGSEVPGEEGNKKQQVREDLEEKKEEIIEYDENGEPIKKKRFNQKTQIAISDALILKPKIVIGDVIKTELAPPAAFGRMAAQTAKQVVTQKLREAERMTIHSEFKTREGEVLVGTIQRREGRNFLVDIGKTIGIIPPEHQSPIERFVSGQRVKVLVASVDLGLRGPEIILSRAHPEFVRRLFEQEIPEIGSGAIEIMSVAREAGSRTKVAVKARQADIDPIGSCVGQRGTRVQTIINEINGEKIDIILYNDNPSVFISNALSPAKISRIEVDENNKSALVVVKDDQLSLAIGRNGQNVRLAAKLTGWKINITGENNNKVISSEEQTEKETVDKVEEEKTETKKDVLMIDKPDEVLKLE